MSREVPVPRRALFIGAALLLFAFPGNAQTGNMSGTLVVRPGTPVGGSPPPRPPSGAEIALFGVPKDPDRLDRVFYREGFPYVVAIIVNGEFVCSGAWIGDRYVLTAGHCFIQSGKSLDAATTTVAAHFPFADSGKCYRINDRIFGRKSTVCDKPAIQVESLKLHPDYLANTGSTTTDISLLRLGEVPAHSIMAPAVMRAPAALVANEPLNPEMIDLTLAGYGYTGVRGDWLGDFVEVGWQKAHVLQDQIEWDAEDEGLSTGCYADSGAPIISGVQQGFSDEIHTLIGTLVGAEPDEKNPNRESRLGSCLTGTGLGTNLQYSRVNDWLCAELEGSAAKCIEP